MDVQFLSTILQGGCLGDLSQSRNHKYGSSHRNESIGKHQQNIVRFWKSFLYHLTSRDKAQCIKAVSHDTEEDGSPYFHFKLINDLRNFISEDTQSTAGGPQVIPALRDVPPNIQSRPSQFMVERWRSTFHFKYISHF